MSKLEAKIKADILRRMIANDIKNIDAGKPLTPYAQA